MNDEVLIRKLLADGDGVGDDRRLANIYKMALSFTKAQNEQDRLPIITICFYWPI